MIWDAIGTMTSLVGSGKCGSYCCLRNVDLSSSGHSTTTRIMLLWDCTPDKVVVLVAHSRALSRDSESVRGASRMAWNHSLRLLCTYSGKLILNNTNTNLTFT